MTISDRIKKQMERLNLKGVDITRGTGVSSGGVSQWVNGITTPKGDNLIALSKILKCDPEWLLTGKEPESDRYRDSLTAARAGYNQQPGLTKSATIAWRATVPLISWVQAGDWSEAVDPMEPGHAEDHFPSPAPHSKRAFALRVEGDSMTSPTGRSYPHGMILVVDPEQRGGVKPGDRVIAKLDGSNEVTFKQLAEDRQGLFLKPLNPASQPIYAEFHIIGKVIGAWQPE